MAKRILVNENLRYLTQHRAQMKAEYPDFPTFRLKFNAPQSLVDTMIKEGKKTFKGTVSDKEEQQTIALLKHMAKALIARDLWDMSEYFAIIYEKDDIVNKAVQLMEEQQ